jgi:hypothetical protein
MVERSLSFPPSPRAFSDHPKNPDRPVLKTVGFSPDEGVFHYHRSAEKCNARFETFGNHAPSARWIFFAIEGT